MVDISKCEGHDCPMKHNCFRFTSTPSKWQSYMAEIPYKDGECDSYYPAIRKGEVVRSIDYWAVRYMEDGEKKFLPLHPDDVEDILELEKNFDNIEARINEANPRYFFVKYNRKMDGESIYAKLLGE